MGFKRAASNIGWTAKQDETVWRWMKELGYTGLEIAPTRLFAQAPYECCNGAALFAGVMHQQYGFSVVSMQSIWYGRTGNIFVPEEAAELEEYTLAALEFARSCRCANLVFGCPRNRNRPKGADEKMAEDFSAAWAPRRPAGAPRSPWSPIPPSTTPTISTPPGRRWTW